MERRVRRLSAIFQGGDSEPVQRCADYLYWAFLPLPVSGHEQDARIAGYLDLIDRSGIGLADLPRALALALARYSGGDVADAEQAVALLGAAAILSAMALPPHERTAFLEPAPNARERFMDGLVASG
jgi:hypothetical protein